MMVWAATEYTAHTFLVRVKGNSNTDPHISEILRRIFVACLGDLRNAIFQQYNARPNVSRRVLIFDCCPVPERSLDLPPTEKFDWIVPRMARHILSS